MEISEINPYIRRTMHSILNAPFQINRRVILDYELLYLENGNFLLNYGENIYKCRKGDIILIHPGIPHSFKSTGVNISQPHIHFDLQYDNLSPSVFISFKDFPELSEIQRKMIRNDAFYADAHSPIIFVADTSAFLKLFYYIVDSFSGQQTLECKAEMIQLLDMIIKSNYSKCFKNKEIKDDNYQYIKSYIDMNYKSRITLYTLESQFHYNRFYIEKLFKKKHGVSAIKYCNNLKMEFAKSQLMKLSVSEISRQAGYTSIYTFSRAFRKHFGCSPTEYKLKVYG